MRIPHWVFSSIILFVVLACRNSEFVTIGQIKVPRTLIEAANEDDFDYTGTLAKALQNDAKSINKLISFNCSDSHLSMHGDVLLEVLKISGDSLFSIEIASLAETTKQSVWKLLDAGCKKSNTTLGELAPRTLTALTPPPVIMEYEGVYLPLPKQSEILLCQSANDRYALIDENGLLSHEYKRILRKPYPGQSIFFRAKGHIASHHGSNLLPAHCSGFFVIDTLIATESRNFKNTCIPYELWALGVEPFWYIMISSKIGVIEFLEMGEPSARNFNYSAPVESFESLVYTAFNEGSGDNIRIEVLNKPCADGMSGRQYPLQVHLNFNGKVLNGCGFTFEHRNVMIEEN